MKIITFLLLFVPCLSHAQNDIKPKQYQQPNDSIETRIKIFPTELPHAIRIDLYKAFMERPVYEISYEHPLGTRNALQTDIFYTENQGPDPAYRRQYDMDFNYMNGYGLNLTYKYYQKTRHDNYRYYFGLGLAAKHYFFQRTGDISITDNDGYIYYNTKAFEQSCFTYGFTVNNGYQFRISQKLELGVDWGLEFKRLNIYKNGGIDNEFIYFETRRVPNDYEFLSSQVSLILGIRMAYLW
ncbi:hypothetical protein [Persicobacter sp. CCB-QB2]|uniref:hypothetical protein n=1 Tax=Persicobacter sp. CCB-QB2 TaxID=1561025 RepID=UPI0006A9D3CD|nr:hypothetical protein [Persicobacter sp. CCB-QB2]